MHSVGIETNLKNLISDFKQHYSKSYQSNVLDLCKVDHNFRGRVREALSIILVEVKTIVEVYTIYPLIEEFPDVIPTLITIDNIKSFGLIEKCFTNNRYPVFMPCLLNLMPQLLEEDVEFRAYTFDYIIGRNQDERLEPIRPEILRMLPLILKENSRAQEFAFDYIKRKPSDEKLLAIRPEILRMLPLILKENSRVQESAFSSIRDKNSDEEFLEIRHEVLKLFPKGIREYHIPGHLIKVLFLKGGVWINNEIEGVSLC